MRQLGQYKILRKLGAGAMGEVYLAEHARMGVPYAVKVLPEALSADREARERFVSEARVMATLRHPNIVQVHNMDVDGDIHYIVMDFVSPDGRNPNTLDDVLRERGGRLPEGEVMRILEQICEALIHSHSQGVIHCDIKPSNILLDKDNMVRVSDFGLAKIMGSAFIQQSIAMSLSGSLGVSRTIAPQQQTASAKDSLGAENTLGYQGSSRAESFVGTFHYMPPEVQKGGMWTEHGDIYSIGVLIYAMITGDLPIGRWKMPSELVEFLRMPFLWDGLSEHSLEITVSDRFPTVKEMLDYLNDLGDYDNHRHFPDLLAAEWYYKNGNKKEGPFSFRELVRHITLDTEVRHSGFETWSWTRAGDIPELRDKLRQIKTSPIPPPIRSPRQY